LTCVPAISASACLLQLVDAANPANSNVLIKLDKPGAASHVLSLKRGEVVEIVIQNNRGGFNGGEYASNNDTLTNNRNGREQHSFHLHGHHFWLVRGICMSVCFAFVAFQAGAVA
jgi:hypothetical protein